MHVINRLLIPTVFVFLCFDGFSDDPGQTPEVTDLIGISEFLKLDADKDTDELTTQFYQRDIDGDLLLSADERSRKTLDGDNAFWQTFQRLDSDCNKLISREEYVGTANKEDVTAARKEFQRADRNSDDVLNYPEALETPRFQVSSEVRFRRWNADGNNLLSLAEFLGLFAANLRQQVRQEFFCRDFDGDLQVSHQEFVGEVKGQHPHWRATFVSRDLNEDGQLSREEYIKPNIGGKWEEAARKESVTSDLNDDGFFSPEEFCFSAPAHSTAEQRFQVLDVDQDGRLTENEFLMVFPKVAEKRRLEFRGRDGDSNTHLDLAEFSAEEWRQTVRSRFLERDLNHDGLVSAEEYIKPLLGGEWEKAAREEAVRYDVDKNGFFTLHEYLWSPNANASWQERFAILNTNNDKLLTVQEYLQGQSPADLYAHRIQFFRRDIDEDRRLTIKEFSVDMLPTASLKNSYAAVDLNNDGQVSCDEYVASITDAKVKAAAETEAKQSDIDGDDLLSVREFSLTPRASVSRKQRFQLVDVDESGRLSPREYLASIDRTARGSERIRFFQLDTDGDRQLSLQEYISENSVAELGFEASYLSLDVNEDGRVSKSEYVTPHVGGKFHEAARSEADRYDLDQDGFLSRIEFVHTPRPDPTDDELFELLAADDPEIPLVKAAKFLVGTHGVHTDDVVWQQRLMDVDNRVQQADADCSNTLSPSEFQTARTEVKKPARARRSPVISSGNSGASWRFYSLIGFNFLLIVGIAWYILNK